jgi:hypothetical protein
MKDWTGNKKSIYVTLGASNHTEEDRQKEDFYATDPKAAQLLLELETFNKNIWEPACGMGHLSEVFKQKGYNVKSTDLIDRGYGTPDVDFLMQTDSFDGDIITNPPYKFAMEFIEKSLMCIPTGNKVAMFLKMTFVEGKGRKSFFNKYPPKIIYVSSSRINCPKNGDFTDNKSSAVCYAWYIWEKGYKGDTTLKWFN